MLMMEGRRFLAAGMRKTHQQKQVWCPSIENVLWLCCCRRHRRVYWLLSGQRGNQRQPTNQHSCKAFLSRNLPSSGSNLLCRKLRAIHAGLHQLSRSSTTSWRYLLRGRSFPETDRCLQPVGSPPDHVFLSGREHKREDHLGLSC